MNPSFNLIDEAWIPCVMADEGAARLLGLREVLIRAPAIREVADPSPLVTAALHRLLLAILHRNFGPPSAAAWAELWERGRFDAECLDAYFAAWRSRFDLFDLERPFYQVASLDAEYAVPIAKRVNEVAGITYTTLFDHTLEGPEGFVPAAAAARFLIAHQAFAVRGTISLEKGADPRIYKFAKAGPLNQAAVVLVKGRTLFETLLYMLHAYAREDELPFPFQEGVEDRPAWEQEEAASVQERRPFGYLDLLTWQSRRMRLIPDLCDGRPVVRAAVIMKGRQFPAGWSLHQGETMAAFVKNARAKPGEEPYYPIGFQRERALWRDSLALFQSIENRWRRPRILDWLADLMAEGYLERSRTVPLDALGLCSDQANLLFWRHERLPLPLRYLDDDRLIDALRRALEWAEEVGRELGRIAQRLARLLLAPNSDDPAARQPDGKLVQQMVRRLGLAAAYWARLEVPFRSFLVDLASDVEQDESGAPVYGTQTLPSWAAQLRATAWQAWREVTDGLDGSTRTLRAVAVAERLLGARLDAILERPRPSVERRNA